MRKDKPDLVDIERLNNKLMYKQFTEWKEKAESYPYMFFCFRNKHYYHILKGPILLFPSLKVKKQIVTTEEFNQIINQIYIDGNLEWLMRYLDGKFALILSKEGEQFYYKMLNHGMEICHLCNRLLSRIRVCNEICFYHKHCLKRGPLCHYYHIQDLEKGALLQGYIDLNSVRMALEELWEKFPNGRIHFACSFIRFEDDDQPGFIVKIVRKLSDIVLDDAHNVKCIDKNLYKFYLPVIKTNGYCILNYGMRRVIHHKND